MPSQRQALRSLITAGEPFVAPECYSAAAVHIEDEITPKHSTLDGPLMPIPEMQARIGAAIEARMTRTSWSSPAATSDQAEYDAVVTTWATRAGRPIRQPGT